MVHVTYTIVEHDGGWAYKLGDVFSEPFRTREAAVKAAQRAAAEQRVPGRTEAIMYRGQGRKMAPGAGARRRPARGRRG